MNEQDNYLYRLGALYTDTIEQSDHTIICDYGISINPTYRQVHVAKDLTLLDLYSYLHELWCYSNILIRYPFPMVAITKEKFEFVDSWQPASEEDMHHLTGGTLSIKDPMGGTILEYSDNSTLGDV